MSGLVVRRIAAGLVVIFSVSLGLGYAVGAQVRPDGGAADHVDVVDVAAPAPGPATTGQPTTTPTTTAAPTTVSTNPSTTSTTESPTTTTEPPTTVPSAPLKVVLAGDSVMAGLAPAVKAGLENDGAAEVRFLLTPSLLRDPAARYSWTRQLDEFDPDVVVMYVGTWESGTSVAGEPGTPGWLDRYESEVLDPWVSLLTAHGASVVWIGNATVGNPDANRVFGLLDEAFRSLPDRWAGVHYLDPQLALNGDEPGFHDVISVNGRRLRTRQLDGLHLCPDGAALLGSLVVRTLAEDHGLEPARGWEQGDWRTDVVYPVESCPAP